MPAFAANTDPPHSTTSSTFPFAAAAWLTRNFPIPCEISLATFDPSGRMNFDIEVHVRDHNGPPGKSSLPFDASRDLELGLAFNGPSMRPTFFPYLFTDMSGQVSFTKGTVDLQNFAAKHG